MNEENRVLSERIDELETRVAFQEDTLSQLNDVIATQDAQIRSLVARIRDISEKYQDLTFEMQKGQKPGDEKPPHY